MTLSSFACFINIRKGNKNIIFWMLQSCLQGSIEGRRDLAGGRLSSDRRALGNSTSGQCFTSLAFSADGAFLLAGGSTKYVCMYDVEEKVMLRRFQASLLYLVCAQSSSNSQVVTVK